MMLWTGKRSIVILSLILPVLIVPLVSVLLFPQIPLTTSISAGFILSLFLAIGLRLIQGTKALGTRFIVAVAIIAVLCLLIGILSNRLL